MKAMTLRLSPELYERLAIVADVDRKPVIKVVREAITEYLKRMAPPSLSGGSRGR